MAEADELLLVTSIDQRRVRSDTLEKRNILVEAHLRDDYRGEEFYADPTFILCLDVSKSMSESFSDGRNRLGAVLQATECFLEQLSDQDRVSLVTFASTPSVVFANQEGRDRRRLVNSLVAEVERRHLAAGQQTNIGPALTEVVRLAAQPGRSVRVAILSDGEIHDESVGVAEARKLSNVTIDTFGIGKQWVERTLRKLTSGAIRHFETVDQARREFVNSVRAGQRCPVTNAYLKLEPAAGVSIRDLAMVLPDRKLLDVTPGEIRIPIGTMNAHQRYSFHMRVFVELPKGPTSREQRVLKCSLSYDLPKAGGGARTLTPKDPPSVMVDHGSDEKVDGRVVRYGYLHEVAELWDKVARVKAETPAPANLSDVVNELLGRIVRRFRENLKDEDEARRWEALAVEAKDGFSVESNAYKRAVSISTQTSNNDRDLPPPRPKAGDAPPPDFN